LNKVYGRCLACRSHVIPDKFVEGIHRPVFVEEDADGNITNHGCDLFICTDDTVAGYFNPKLDMHRNK
jgi:hypothetical protein